MIKDIHMKVVTYECTYTKGVCKNRINPYECNTCEYSLIINVFPLK